MENPPLNYAIKTMKTKNDVLFACRLRCRHVRRVPESRGTRNQSRSCTDRKDRIGYASTHESWQRNRIVPYPTSSQMTDKFASRFAHFRFSIRSVSICCPISSNRLISSISSGGEKRSRDPTTWMSCNNKIKLYSQIYFVFIVAEFVKT